MIELRAAYRFSAFALLLGLVGCGGGGGGDDNPPPTGQPTVTLAANPTSINSGQSSTLTWSSTNATSCTASGGWSGAKATSGTEQVTPVATGTYTLSCTGTAGSASQSATVTVVNPPPTLTLTVSDPLVVPTEAATLTWSTTNATTCMASGGWSGTKGTSGSESTGLLTAATTFALDCTGPGGSVSESVAVSVAASGNTVVRGRIQFERPPFSSVAGQGLNFSSLVISPARQVVVEIIDATSLQRISATATDANGGYWLEVTQDVEMFVRARAEMISSGSAPTWTFRVLNNTNNGALYVLDGESFVGGSASSTRDLLAQTGWNGTSYGANRPAAPFAILDTVYRTKELILGALPTTSFPILYFYWSPNNRATVASFCTTSGNIGTTFYTGGAPALNSGNCTPQVALFPGIYVLGDYAGGAGDTDEFDQHVIAHEFGHYVEAEFSRSDSIGGEHTTGNRLDLRVAFSEGWGNAYSGMALNDPIYRDSHSGVSADFAFDMESDSSTAEGWYSEASVQEILWDLFDSTNDGTDTISLGFPPIYSAMTGPQRTTDAMTSIYTFASGLRTIADSTQIASINALLTGESISSTADAFGSGEQNSGGNPMALPIYANIDRNQPLNLCGNGDTDGSNKLGARRFLRLTLPSATALGITVQGAVGPGAPAGSQPASDPDIYVYNRGTLVEAGTSTTSQPGSSETLPQRVYPAGVNILEVHDYVGGAVSHCMTVSISG